MVFRGKCWRRNAKHFPSFSPTAGSFNSGRLVHWRRRRVAAYRGCLPERQTACGVDLSPPSSGVALVILLVPGTGQLAAKRSLP